MQNEKTGTLYVVATPIGNLKDMSQRAIEVLKAVDRIAVEDTRHSAPLLKHFSIIKPTISMHDYNEQARIAVMIDYLQGGESVAIISDAGTPLISDPGFGLVRKAKEFGIPVVPVPGACAAITALSVSGLPTDRFTFEGFLPPKDESRKNRLSTLRHEARTMIFYEAPHRLLSSLEAMATVFGATRYAVVARELTKMYESVLTEPLESLIAFYAANPGKQKGEVVILVSGVDEAESETREVKPLEVLEVLMAELPLKQAVSLANKITGHRRNELYDLALQKKNTT